MYVISKIDAIQAREISDSSLKAAMKIFASLSHELRTPLNCSLSMLEVYSQLNGNDKQTKEYIEPALVSNKLMLSLVNDILDFV